MKQKSLNIISLSLLSLCLMAPGNLFVDEKEVINPVVHHIRYDDETYDSKYILSPITTTTLNPNSYYIIVNPTYVYRSSATTESPSYEQTGAAAFCTDFESGYGNCVVFDFVDFQSKTIDIRELGAHAGGCIHQYVETTMQDPFTSEANIKTYRNFYSLSKLSYLYGDSSYHSIVASGYSNIENSTTWTISSKKENNIPMFSFYDPVDSFYFYAQNSDYIFENGQPRMNYSTEVAEEVSDFSLYHYIYEVSETLVNELTFAGAAKTMATSSDSQVRSLFTSLPSYSRERFVEFYNNMEAGSDTSSDTVHSAYYSSVLAGVRKYQELYEADFTPQDISNDVVVNYEKGVIEGFSPFEKKITLVYTENEDEVINVYDPIDNLMSDEYCINNEKTKNRKVFLKNSDMDLYGKSISLYYGDYQDYPELSSKNPLVLSVQSLDTSSYMEGSLQVDTLVSGGENVSYILDGEVHLKQIGELGDYEYALADQELFELWEPYDQHANTNKLVFQESPVFTQYVTLDGLIDIHQESTMMAFIRKKGENGVTSPVLECIQDIYAVNDNDGYVLRMNTLNEELYSSYSTEYQDVYQTLASDEHFAMFNLESIESSVEDSIASLSSKESATGILTPEGLEKEYAGKTYIHSTIAQSYMDAYSLNQTTRSLNTKDDLIQFLSSYEIDYSLSTEEIFASIDSIISSYENKLEEGASIDTLCQNFISYFNEVLASHPTLSSTLWDHFNENYSLIHNSTTLAQANTNYQTAVSNIEGLLG